MTFKFHSIYKLIQFCILKLKFLHVIKVEYFSYPCVNLLINYACIKIKPDQSDQKCRMPTFGPFGKPKKKSETKTTKCIINIFIFSSYILKSLNHQISSLPS
jgi:hypothetical protein